jgi:hypothetical protein
LLKNRNKGLRKKRNNGLETPLFSHPRVFDGPNLWERAIKGYGPYHMVWQMLRIIPLLKN